MSLQLAPPLASVGSQQQPGRPPSWENTRFLVEKGIVSRPGGWKPCPELLEQTGGRSSASGGVTDVIPQPWAPSLGSRNSSRSSVILGGVLGGRVRVPAGGQVSGGAKDVSWATVSSTRSAHEAAVVSSVLQTRKPGPGSVNNGSGASGSRQCQDPRPGLWDGEDRVAGGAQTPTDLLWSPGTTCASELTVPCGRCLQVHVHCSAALSVGTVPF